MISSAAAAASDSSPKVPPTDLKSPSCSSWQPRQIPVEEAFKKMVKNTHKALSEHHIKCRSGCYAAPQLVVDRILNKDEGELPLLAFSHRSAEAQGIWRRTMEDAHFHIEIAEGMLCGIFDGHGGRDVANYANENFQKRFSQFLQQAKGNVHQAFEELIHALHMNITLESDWSKWVNMGTTAVLCFVDKKTHLIYTATIGDSEAHIYRRYTDALKSIPISCVRDWSSPKEALRAAIAHNSPGIIEEWKSSTNPKLLRAGANGLLLSGLNVSRAIGDWCNEDKNGNRIMIHKPKITVNRVQPGDYLILGCDGLKDYVTEDEMVSIIAQHGANEANLAQILLDHALKTSTDNVTVVVVKIA